MTYPLLELMWHFILVTCQHVYRLSLPSETHRQGRLMNSAIVSPLTSGPKRQVGIRSMRSVVSDDWQVQQIDNGMDAGWSEQQLADYD